MKLASKMDWFTISNIFKLSLYFIILGPNFLNNKLLPLTSLKNPKKNAPLFKYILFKSWPLINWQLND